MTAITQRAERFLLRLRYLLWQRNRHQRLVLESVAGYELLILPEVMNPRIFRSGEFFAQVLAGDLVPRGSQVLDMGTGSGITAIAAAKRAARVVAVDINPAAVRCARLNVILNNVEDRVFVRRGDLFSAVESERFDLVLFNPPYFRGKPEPGFDQAWRSENTVERFAAQLRAYLTVDGSALLLLSTDGETADFLRAFAAQHYGYEVVARRRLLAETLSIYRFRPMSKE